VSLKYSEKERGEAFSNLLPDFLERGVLPTGIINTLIALRKLRGGISVSLNSAQKKKGAISRMSRLSVLEGTSALFLYKRGKKKRKLT